MTYCLSAPSFSAEPLSFNPQMDLSQSQITNSVTGSPGDRMEDRSSPPLKPMEGLEGFAFPPTLPQPQDTHAHPYTYQHHVLPQGQALRDQLWAGSLANNHGAGRAAIPISRTSTLSSQQSGQLALAPEYPINLQQTQPSFSMPTAPVSEVADLPSPMTPSPSAQSTSDAGLFRHHSYPDESPLCGHPGVDVLQRSLTQTWSHSSRGNSSSSSSSSSSGKGDRPMTEKEMRRKEQNRAAQRAFRERKERRIQELEESVSTLESASASLSHENLQIRLALEQLNAENESLLTTSFGSYTPQPRWGEWNG